MDKKTVIFPLVIIVCAVLLRLLPHPANAAPIAAIALFGAVYLDKRYAFVLPLTALFLSDLLLGFHDTMLFVYGSFLVAGGIGLWIRQKKSLLRIASGTLLSSVLFFLITNFGVWFMGSLYPKTVAGLLESYVMGIPFFRGTVLGDVVYTALCFGSYELGLFLATVRKKTYGQNLH